MGYFGIKLDVCTVFGISQYVFRLVGVSRLYVVNRIVRLENRRLIVVCYVNVCRRRILVYENLIRRRIGQRSAYG